MYFDRTLQSAMNLKDRRAQADLLAYLSLPRPDAKKMLLIGWAAAHRELQRNFPIWKWTWSRSTRK
jgi:hypothetical protein